MPILQNMAIKHKLISIIMLACVTALVLAGAAFIGWERSNFRNQMVRSLSTQAEMIAENCKAALAFQDAEDAKQTLQALHVEPSIVFGCVYKKDNKLFVTYYRDYAEIKVYPPELQESGFSFAEGFLTAYKPIVLDGEIVGTVCLRSDMSAMYAMLKRNISIIIVVIFLSSLAAFLVSARLQKVISGPILGLAESAIKIGKGDLTHRVQVHSKDELGYLAKSFNEMAEHLQTTTTSIDNLNREIAQRKKAEEELQVRTAILQNIISNIPYCVFWKDKNSVYLWCNDNFAKLAGVEKPEDVIGKTDYDLPWKKEESDSYRKIDKDVVSKGAPILNIEEQVHHGKGKVATILTSKVPLRNADGEITGVLGIFTDITERKRAEQKQAELLKQLESANKELNDFAHIVSHDLKAPLRGIKTLANWISTDYADKLDEDGREQMDLLSSRVDRMHNLIDGILQYSRVGRIKEEMSQVNLNELVPDIIDMIASSESITVTVENELPVIECEKTRIIQVFQNLLSNAVKYMDKSQGQIRIGCVEEDGCWKFSVADNGPGIEERHFEKIFQIFQTLSPRDELESTGLGLTLVKKIVEMYGGQIWIESKMGEGSTFFFTLPKQKVGGKNAKPQASIVSRR